MGWDVRMAWTLLILAALLLAWAVWRSWPRVTDTGPGAAPPDPFAAEVAEFNAAVSDWSRRG